MKHAIELVLLSGLVAASASAFADNSSNMSSNMAPTSKTQMMKKCMAKQKADNANGMSQQAMETTCKNEVYKKAKNGNDLASGPHANQPSQ